MTSHRSGCAHRARPLDVVEAEARAARLPWPQQHRCTNGCHTAVCDCGPAPAEACSEFLADPPRPKPPAYPWRAFGLWFVVVFALLGVGHAVGVFQKPAAQVATR